MPSSQSAEQLYATLRRLAATDPREARSFVNTLMDENHSGLDELLRNISVPGEGRTRQIVANAVRQRKDKARVVPFLLQWRDVEADEFTKEAIAAALEGIDASLHRPSVGGPMPDMVDTYRYVADRLCHRIRNALTNPSARLRRLQSIVVGIGDDTRRGEVTSELSQIMDAFQKLSRLVEFDVSDGYFQHRPLNLKDWITAMNRRYSATNEPVVVTIIEEPVGASYCIRANDQILETAFWNLWNNSTQAVQNLPLAGIQCQITVRMRLGAGNRVDIAVEDNGPGIPRSIADSLLSVGFSTKGEGRGRGLLEVQDAVRRLFGTVKLIEVRPGECRIHISFPLEKT